MSALRPRIDPETHVSLAAGALTLVIVLFALGAPRLLAALFQMLGAPA